MANETLVPFNPPPPFGSPYVLALAVVAGPGPYDIHRLAREETVVGRAGECDFVLDDSEVSSRHIAIEVVGTVYTLVELGGRNGTLLNGKAFPPKSRARIKTLDEIQVGKTRLLFTASKFHD
jgi:pSer/pThr/pTyr-binding forkhead associated (FHA) protein